MAEWSEPSSVLITGGCGFIGSNFINYIFDKWNTAKIINYDKLAHGASPDNVVAEIRADPRYSLVVAPLEDIEILDATLREHKIDVIVHFAAITHVDESYANRVGTIQDNILSTSHLLEAVTNRGYKGLKRFVHISTDEVYGDSKEGEAPKTETTIPNPTNPYAASKAACELILQAYFHSYKLPFVMVRMNNVYGPRQAKSKLIPKFTQLAIEGKPYPLMGDGLHSRSWMFVEDCSEAIKRVAEKGKLGEVYNIGIDFEMSNIELTRRIHSLVNKLQNKEETEPKFAPISDRPYHDRRYNIDFSKVNKATGWSCSTPFDEGLARTVDFYLKEHFSGTAEAKPRRIHG